MTPCSSCGKPLRRSESDNGLCGACDAGVTHADDRPDPPDRAAEDVSPWDVDPAELRDQLAHAPVGEYLDWLRA